MMSEQFQRKEHRYVGYRIKIKSLNDVASHRVYDVTTDYYQLKHKPIEKGGPKIRVRTYGSGDTFVELKKKDSKQRRPISNLLKKWIDKLEYLFTLTYERTEVILMDGTRITEDHNLTLNGKIVYAKPIVEIKGTVPQWWKKKDNKSWSKSKWALGVLGGEHKS